MNDADDLIKEIERLRKENADLTASKQQNEKKMRRASKERKAAKAKIHKLNKQLSEKDNELKAHRRRSSFERAKQRNEQIAAMQMQNAVNHNKKHNHHHQIFTENERKCHLNKEIEEKDPLQERVDTTQSFQSVIHELKKHPNALKKGHIVITIKKKCSMQMIDYLNDLVKNVCANNGFDQGIWQKRRHSHDYETVVFIFNYFQEDIMSCPGVRELMMMLSQIEAVHAEIKDSF